MNVGEAKKILGCYEDDVEIVLAADSEGNGFAKLSVAEIADFDFTQMELIDDEELDHRQGLSRPVAIVLWP